MKREDQIIDQSLGSSLRAACAINFVRSEGVILTPDVAIRDNADLPPCGKRSDCRSAHVVRVQIFEFGEVNRGGERRVREGRMPRPFPRSKRLLVAMSPDRGKGSCDGDRQSHGR